MAYPSKIIFETFDSLSKIKSSDFYYNFTDIGINHHFLIFLVIQEYINKSCYYRANYRQYSVVGKEIIGNFSLFEDIPFFIPNIFTCEVLIAIWKVSDSSCIDLSDTSRSYCVPANSPISLIILYFENYEVKKGAHSKTGRCTKIAKLDFFSFFGGF